MTQSTHTSSVFNLQKDVEKVRFVLEKAGIHEVPAQVKVVLDVSQSAQHLYANQNGRPSLVQQVVERSMAVALACDQNGVIECFGFSADAVQACDISQDNYIGYVDAEILEVDGELEPILWQNTHYAPAIKLVLEQCGLLTQKRSWFFGRSSEQLTEDTPDGTPVICYFYTDGENQDQQEAWQLFEQMRDAGSQAYWILVGIGNASFQFLREAAEHFPNVGFVPVLDLATFVSNDDVFEQLVPRELCKWLKHEHEGEDHHDDDDDDDHHV